MNNSGTTTSSTLSNQPTGDQRALFAPLKDRLVACAWWNLAEADKADEASCERGRAEEEREYHRRRRHRLTAQAKSLFAQASVAEGR